MEGYIHGVEVKNGDKVEKYVGKRKLRKDIQEKYIGDGGKDENEAEKMRNWTKDQKESFTLGKRVF